MGQFMVKKACVHPQCFHTTIWKVTKWVLKRVVFTCDDCILGWQQLETSWHWWMAPAHFKRHSLTRLGLLRKWRKICKLFSHHSTIFSSHLFPSQKLFCQMLSGFLFPQQKDLKRGRKVTSWSRIWLLFKFYTTHVLQNSLVISYLWMEFLSPNTKYLECGAFLSDYLRLFGSKYGN